MEKNLDYALENDTEYMLGKIREYYGYYFDASHRLRTNQIFALDSIYQCISQLNNNKNYSDNEHRIRIYNAFCRRVKEQSGINFKVNTKDGYRVIKKSKKNPFNIFKN